ncbi:MAG: DUF72 domain-containing protein [Nanoarchaeota archaeon]
MLAVGTSGYSYDEWASYFYPSSLKGKEMLQFYAQFFDMVEINSTFNHIPPAEMMGRIAQKAPPQFVFSIKVFRAVTYDRDMDMVQPFLESMMPMVSLGKVKCFVLQFPFTFEDTEANRAFIVQLKRVFTLPLVAEFRSPKWVSEDAFSFLESNDIGFCCVDEPRLKGLFPPIARVTSQIGYVRFNGRNVGSWFHPATPQDRFDYLYSDAELKEWVPKIKAMANLTQDFFVIFSNFPKASAVRNAATLSNLLEAKHIELPPPEDTDSQLSDFF